MTDKNLINFLGYSMLFATGVCLFTYILNYFIGLNDFFVSLIDITIIGFVGYLNKNKIENLIKVLD